MLEAITNALDDREKKRKRDKDIRDAHGGANVDDGQPMSYQVK